MDASQDLIEVIANRVAELVVQRLRDTAQHDLVSQGESPLGSRRHCAAVRRRIDRGQPGASIVGRRHLLSREALAEELSTATTATRPRRAGRLAEL